jgi:hypothetical protein
VCLEREINLKITASSARRFEEESGTPMWEEWRITVWQRSQEIVAQRECAVEAGRRNSGKKLDVLGFNYYVNPTI